MELDALIARLEAASGPDRELDVAIALATGLVREREGNMLFGHDDNYVLERDYYDHGGHPRELPHFTASLDAALTLYPAKPAVIPTDARVACAEALRARASLAVSVQTSRSALGRRKSAWQSFSLGAAIASSEKLCHSAIKSAVKKFRSVEGFRTGWPEAAAYGPVAALLKEFEKQPEALPVDMSRINASVGLPPELGEGGAEAG